jgi:hypothetical protein
VFFWGAIVKGNEVLDDPETSTWLRDALLAALKCDPVRAANDVEVLRAVLHRRVAELGMGNAESDVRFPVEWVHAA